MTRRPPLLSCSLTAEFILRPPLAQVVDVGVPDVVVTTSFRVCRRTDADGELRRAARHSGQRHGLDETRLNARTGLQINGPPEWAVARLLDIAPKDAT